MSFFGISVLYLPNLEVYSVKSADINDYLRRTVRLPSRPTQLAVNCDSTCLCVAVEKEGCAIALIYSIAAFAAEVRETLVCDKYTILVS